MLLQKSSAIAVAKRALVLLLLVVVLLILLIHTGQLGGPVVTTHSPEHLKLLQQYAERRKVKQNKDAIPVLHHNSETHINSTSSEHHNLTTLDDVYIAIKTTRKYHNTRLQLLIDTWIQLAKYNTWVFTDYNDSSIYTQLARGHLINTGCAGSHKRTDLVCKISVLFDRFIQAQQYRWLCIVDDDTYLNIPQLVLLLTKYSHTENWYLGKPSLNYPLRTHDSVGNPITFWFATGGAGYCISRSLALKMLPYAGGGRIYRHSDRIKLPDDVTIGYIINLCEVELTKINALHSHLEGLWQIQPNTLREQISLSYGEVRTPNQTSIFNVVNTGKDIQIDPNKDPTRLRSIHCWIFPGAPNCPTANRNRNTS